MLFELTAKHYIDDRLLEPGQVIGHGKLPPGQQAKIAGPYPGTPTVDMIPLDAEAEQAHAKYVAEHPEALVAPLDHLSRTMDDPRDPAVQSKAQMQALIDGFTQLARALGVKKAA